MIPPLYKENLLDTFYNYRSKIKAKAAAPEKFIPQIRLSNMAYSTQLHPLAASDSVAAHQVLQWQLRAGFVASFLTKQLTHRSL